MLLGNKESFFHEDFFSFWEAADWAWGTRDGQSAGAKIPSLPLGMPDPSKVSGC
jgi:hypothetical protein